MYDYNYNYSHGYYNPMPDYSLLKDIAEYIHDELKDSNSTFAEQ